MVMSVEAPAAPDLTQQSQGQPAAPQPVDPGSLPEVWKSEALQPFAQNLAKDGDRLVYQVQGPDRVQKFDASDPAKLMEELGKAQHNATHKIVDLSHAQAERDAQIAARDQQNAMLAQQLGQLQGQFQMLQQQQAPRQPQGPVTPDWNAAVAQTAQQLAEQYPEYYPTPQAAQARAQEVVKTQQLEYQVRTMQDGFQQQLQQTRNEFAQMVAPLAMKAQFGLDVNDQHVQGLLQKMTPDAAAYVLELERKAGISPAAPTYAQPTTNTMPSPVNGGYSTQDAQRLANTLRSIQLVPPTTGYGGAAPPAAMQTFSEDEKSAFRALHGGREGTAQELARTYRDKSREPLKATF